MNRTTRKRLPLVVALAAAGLIGSTVTAHAGTIDVRVSPGTRMTKSTPASVTPSARWSRKGNAAQVPSVQRGAVHYPTVVLGTTNYLEPAPTGAAQASYSQGSLRSRWVTGGAVYGDMLTMVFGTEGAITDGNFSASTVDGVNVIGGNLANSPAAFVSSPFIGVAGPGFGFGVAGPGFGLGVAGPGVGFVNQDVIVRSNGTGRAGDTVSSGTLTGGNTVMSGWGTIGATSGNASGGGAVGAGNIVIGVGGAALSGGGR